MVGDDGDGDGVADADADVQTELQTLKERNTTVRRRFQDFTFLHDQLAKAFPACVIPPIPDKHRLGELYVVGWRSAIMPPQRRPPCLA